MTTLTKEIRKLRKEKGLTQQDVADKLKLKKSTYAKKEIEGAFTVDEIPGLHKILGGSKDVLTNLALKSEEVNIEEWREYLIKSALSTNAMMRVIITALSEVLAKQRGESVTKVLGELTMAVEGEKSLNSMKS